jgi:signal transduction histidine kinase
MLLAGATIALIAAALLVMYLQRQSAEQHRAQTAVIVKQVCEQSAAVVTEHLRKRFAGAVFDTIEGIGHPELLGYDLPRVARFFGQGLVRYPYVDRFFLWSDSMPASAREEVLFYRPTGVDGPPAVHIAGSDGRAMGALYSQPGLGGTILKLAKNLAPVRYPFVVVEETVDGVPYQILIHYLWRDARQQEYFALLGYTVDLERLRRDLFGRALAAELPLILNPDPRAPRLALTVSDERGERIYGPEVAEGAPFATSQVDMLFFPSDTLRPWLGAQPERRQWALTVSAATLVARPAPHGYWLFAAAVFLILIALFFAVTLDRQAARLASMQADFVANVSHQLKTPLALLSGAVQTLTLGRLRSEEKLQQYVDIIGTQTSRLSALVDQILHFSRLDTIGGGFEFELVDVGALVAEAVAGFRVAVPDDVSLRVEQAQDVPLVRADPAALEQVVLNLLENAVKYGREAGEIVVTVGLVREELAISVRDQGDGIQQAALPRIFEKFYRASTAQRRGFGLGLTIVQTIVRAHGGRIVVDSAPGRGSEFRVLLPLAS